MLGHIECVVQQLRERTFPAAVETGNHRNPVQADVRLLDCAKRHIDDDEKMPIMIEALDILSKGAPNTLYQMLLLTYLHQN